MTLEIRWFFRGTYSNEISEWLEENDFKSKEQIDHYLITPEKFACFLGIKKSRGTFDIKHRSSFYEFQAVKESISGKAEKWEKWELPLIDYENYNFQGINLNQIKVAKARNIRKYNISFPGFTITPTDKRVKQGIQLEVTKIKISNENWWTIGIDCFEDDEKKQQEILQIVVSRFLQIFHKERLEMSNSLSYSEWLSKAKMK